ncbi:MAG: amino acid adenylation domain-containing protein [bacterium]|nr:amino acid adenylation domain-containing protein [bacterium]
MHDKDNGISSSTAATIAAGQFVKERRYWKEKLSGELEKSHFIPDFKKKREIPHAYDLIVFTLDRELGARIKKICKNSDPMLHMILTAGIAALLAKYTGRNDILIGTSIDKQETEARHVNTALPLRIGSKEQTTFKELLLEVKKTVNEAVENQNYPLETLVSEMDIPSVDNEFPLFDLAVILENIQDKTYLSHIRPIITFSFCRVEEALECTVEYDRTLYEKATIQRIISHYLLLLHKTLFNLDSPLRNIELLLEEDKQQLERFNDTKRDYPEGKTIHELFYAQVEKTPDNTAVMHGDRELTYRQLNRLSNQFARLLRAKGVKPGVMVGILTDNSIELLTAMLAVLKAGGAYIPLDSQYPGERRQYILENSGVPILIAPPGRAGNMEWDGESIDMPHNCSDEMKMDCSNLENVAGPSDLAYVIYTSGSTGKPKGVMIEHRGLVNYIWWAAQTYVGNEKLDFPLYTSISFDLTVTSIYTPLLTGNTVIIYTGEVRELLIEQIIADNKAGIVKLTPSHLYLLKEHKAAHSSIKRLIVGGEILETGIARETYENFGGKIEIYNEYGPTETTVGCMIHKFHPEKPYGKSIFIGVPAANTRIYILDRFEKNVPIGALGELYVSGAGVGRGYLKMEQLTAQRFLKDPFVEVDNQRMYKTGDLARRLPDGNIEFFGRFDHQVKIRGFRIELGEIEALLLKHQEIKDTVVITRQTNGSEKSLDAYYVSTREFPVVELRDFLAVELPEYMLPSHFIRLEKIPLTPNGKRDRKALPEPSGSIRTGSEYRAPGNEVEKILAKMWEDVLKIESVGIDDDFFSLGGDSVKAIQLAARLQKHQLKLEIKHLFQYPTISQLSRYVKESGQVVPQSPVEGDVLLTPIQEWFFQKRAPRPHHFNQAVLLYRENGFNEGKITEVFNKILKHHDALRLVFETQEDGTVKQVNKGSSAFKIHLKTYNLNEEKEYKKIIEETCNKIQGSMDLAGGPLVKPVLFRTCDGDYLGIFVHHLVIDAVSWRILFEDLETAYGQLEKGENINLPLKSTSFKEWAEKLHRYSRSKELLEELDYWKEVEATACPPLPVDNHVGKRNIADTHILSMTLCKDYTSKLLKDCHKAYNTEINDLLLAGLGLALKHWAGMDNISVYLEGHGREEIIADTDITRTIGWFTSLFPIILNVDGEQRERITPVIKKTKEMLRNIPNKGIGYGILKYLTPKSEKQDVKLYLAPQIAFNYLGRFDRDITSSFFQNKEISTGNSIALNTPLEYSLEIIGMVTEETLNMSVSYCPKEYRESKMQEFLDAYKQNLEKIIDLCTEKKETELTLSDLSSSDLKEDEMESIFGELEETFSDNE